MNNKFNCYICLVVAMILSVTVIIVNWNKRDDVISLLDSISHLCDFPNKIIVVDNASTDTSIQAIKSHGLDVTLIENSENIGGTGGFNTGIRYAISHFCQDYIWLLDNDAIVDPGALSALVEVMRNDTSIAVAGSKILNKNDPSFVVETGAIIEWNTVSPKPLNRNVKNIDNNPAVFDVEYVAICSALFRCSAINRLGFMDERYFLLWDDMDWGFSFFQAGYRVVAVNHSIVYHPPFTEKRSPAIDYYYGIRNPLLTVSKYTRNLVRVRATMSLCRRIAYVFMVSALSRKYYLCRLVWQALADFLNNIWGKLPIDASNQFKIVQPECVPCSEITGHVLVLNSGFVADIISLIGFLKTYCSKIMTIDIVLEDKRKNLFNNEDFSELFFVDFESSGNLLRNTLVYLRLISQKYDYAIYATLDRVSPFASVAKFLVRYDVKNGKFIREVNHKPWVFAAAIALSELIALCLFPVVYLKMLISYRVAKIL